MTNPHKIYLDMVGCRLNQSELERIGTDVRQAGHRLVGDYTEADVAIINTCAVTAKAASDSRQLARRISNAGVERVILTGCWASLEPSMAATLTSVTEVIPNTQKDRLVQLAFENDSATFSFYPTLRNPLPGARKRTRTFIKVQDGCDKRCTFCVTTIARGRSTSVPAKDVLDQVNAAAEGGVKEVILTGVQLGSWGADINPAGRLDWLIEHLLCHTDIPRIRLSSIEPWSITSSLLTLWEDPRLCRQLHIPLQSGSKKILRRMARSTTPEQFSSMVEEVRRIVPDVAITTDIIVGFPGEDEHDFIESLHFVQDTKFADAHVFSYSERPGTAAESFSDPIPNFIRRDRSQRMRSVSEACAYQFRNTLVGKALSVLWESKIELDDRGWSLRGHSSEGVIVQAYGSPEDINQIQIVMIDSQHSDGYLLGRILRNEQQA